MNKEVERPFFSIITPVYNCEKYLKESIESIINQTYASWELILIDDGSTDASGDICDEFSGDSRIKIIHQENVGSLYSRQNGIAIAKGQYVLGVDADDYLDLNGLEKIKKKIDDTGSDLIFFGYRMFGGREGVVKCLLEAEKEYSKKEIMEAVIKETNHSLCNKAIRLDKVKAALRTKINGPRFSVDYTLIIPILCNIDTGYVTEDVLYNYRIYNDSLSHSYKPQQILDIGDVTKLVIHKITTASLMDAHMSKLIYFSYLKIIYFRIYEVFANKSITKEDCRNIHRSGVYIKSRRVESLKYMNIYEFMILKMFRFRQYWALRLLAMVQKVKKRIFERN